MHRSRYIGHTYTQRPAYLEIISLGKLENMSLSEPACSGDSLKEDNKSSLSLSSVNDKNKEKASNLSTKEDNKNVGMTLRSGKKDKEHSSAYGDKDSEVEPGSPVRYNIV